MQTTARQRWTALTLLAAIEFMILLDTSIVNIAYRGGGTEDILGDKKLAIHYITTKVPQFSSLEIGI